MANLVLAPTYSVSLALTGPQGSVTIQPTDEPLSLDLQFALQGRSAARGVVALGSGALVQVDLALEKRVYVVTLTQNTQIQFINGSAGVDGNTFFVELVQGAPGGWQVLWSGAIFSTDIPQVDLSASVGAVDEVGFMYRHGLGCRVMGFNRTA